MGGRQGRRGKGKGRGTKGKGKKRKGKVKWVVSLPEKKTAAQRHEATCSRSHSREVWI